MRAAALSARLPGVQIMLGGGSEKGSEKSDKSNGRGSGKSAGKSAKRSGGGKAKMPKAEAKVFVATMKVGNVGVTLTAADAIGSTRWRGCRRGRGRAVQITE